MFEVVSDFVKSLWDIEQTPPSSPTDSWNAPSPSRTPRTPLRTPLPEPDDYLELLRPRRQAKRPAFLPDTPTKSHRPADRKILKRGKPKAFRCPSCKCRITITPNGNPRKAFQPYEAPPPKPVVPEKPAPKAPKGRAPKDLRRALPVATSTVVGGVTRRRHPQPPAFAAHNLRNAIAFPDRLESDPNFQYPPSRAGRRAGGTRRAAGAAAPAGGGGGRGGRTATRSRGGGATARGGGGRSATSGAGGRTTASRGGSGKTTGTRKTPARKAKTSKVTKKGKKGGKR
ncbi:hypothetical protein LTR85_007631 [Meristemomyces frigidus]|nr:hypothetical protein LTR85_007631 [Meristemomyces frigidus]